MLQYENFEKNGVKYTRAYSDNGMYIEFSIKQKSMLLKEAIFSSEQNLRFTQTRTPIAEMEKSIYINRNELKDMLSCLWLAIKARDSAKKYPTEAETKAYLDGFAATKKEFIKMLGGQDNR